jgi:hypothetical protein
MTTYPGKYICYVHQGATFSKSIVWKDENGALINLTGWKARMHMRETVEAATPFLTLTTENGGITLGGAAGTISLLASAAATSAIQAKQGVYDLEMIAPDTVTVTRLLEGRVIIDQEVTR